MEIERTSLRGKQKHRRNKWNRCPRHVDEACHIFAFDVTIDPRAKLGRTIKIQRRRRMKGAYLTVLTGDEGDYTAVFVDIEGVTVGATVI
jgi:hypothetical protein